MEPVPETERMEEFRPSPLPSLRVSAIAALNPQDGDFSRKPPTLRRSTDPSPTSPSPSSSPSWAPPSLPFKPRASSPLSSMHSRSKSAVSLAPPMTRTQSMPGVNGAGHLLYSPKLRPQSPVSSPSRIRLPRKPVDEAFPSSPTRISVRDQDRVVSEGGSSSSSSNTSPNLDLGGGAMTPSSSRLRRPASPLRNLSHSSSGLFPGLPTTPSSSSSVATSPSYRSYDSLSVHYPFNPAYPSSSMPSTPTSARSRSPSISSLETIPDSPDAEEAALEAERMAQLEAAADAAAAEGGEGKARTGLDAPIRGRTLGFGSSRDKRKRWSVCGAERRQDLDLETIWED